MLFEACAVAGVLLLIALVICLSTSAGESSLAVLSLSILVSLVCYFGVVLLVGALARVSLAGIGLGFFAAESGEEGTACAACKSSDETAEGPTSDCFFGEFSESVV
jgi:hypothetical protein